MDLIKKRKKQSEEIQFAKFVYSMIASHRVIKQLGISADTFARSNNKQVVALREEWIKAFKEARKVSPNTRQRFCGVDEHPTNYKTTKNKMEAHYPNTAIGIYDITRILEKVNILLGTKYKAVDFITYPAKKKDSIMADYDTEYLRRKKLHGVCKLLGTPTEQTVSENDFIFGITPTGKKAQAVWLKTYHEAETLAKRHKKKLEKNYGGFVQDYKGDIDYIKFTKEYTFAKREYEEYESMLGISLNEYALMGPTARHKFLKDKLKITRSALVTKTTADYKAEVDEVFAVYENQNNSKITDVSPELASMFANDKHPSPQPTTTHK